MTDINIKQLLAAFCVLTLTFTFPALANKRNEIAIIYGGGSRGPLIHYPPSEEALGGLSRYAGMTASLRRSHRVSFAVDAGNMVSADSREHRGAIAAAYYDYMNFDAIAPGAGELAFGLREFTAMQRRTLPIAVSNMILPEEPGISKGITLSKKGYDLYFINVLCPSAIPAGGDTLYDPDVRNLQQLLRSPEAVKAHVRAAAVHGSMEEIWALAKTLQELDVIIAADQKKRFAAVTAGNTHILSAGAGNKFAGVFTIRFDKKKRIVSADNKLYPIFQDAAPDKTVERMVGTAAAAVKKKRLDTAYSKPAPVRGVIPFVSDRGGKRDLFLKAAEAKLEYRLSSDEISPRKPMLSTAGNRAAFIYGDELLKNSKLRMVDLAAMESRTVSEGRNVIDAAFSPSDGYLYYIEADSGSDIGAIYKTKMYMYDALAMIGRGDGQRRDLSVSEDGETLLWVSDVPGKRHIYAAGTYADGTLPQRITNVDADYSSPCMSPNSRYAAYLSDHHGFGGKKDLWVLDRKRGTHIRLTKNSNVRGFCWKDDSKTIYFSAGANLNDINSVIIKSRKIILQKASAVRGPKTWSEETPMFIRYKGAPKIVYTREYINGRKKLHWIDADTKIDEEIFTFGDWNEWNE